MVVQPTELPDRAFIDNQERRQLSISSLIVYLSSLLTVIALWLIPIRSPLWLDETVTYVQIKAGFMNLASRQGWHGIPAYQIVAWLFAKLLGTSEVALRVPSVLAMLAAVYLLYRAAKELFDPHTAIVAAVLFGVNRIVIFEAIDARPHVFAVLATNAAIYLLARLRKSNSNLLASCFGAMLAIIVWFHFLYAAIVPALLAGFLVVKWWGRKQEPLDDPLRHARTIRRQIGAVVSGFGIAFLPLVPETIYTFRTRGEHSFDRAPELGDLLATFAPGSFMLVLALTAIAGLIVSALASRQQRPLSNGVESWRILLCQILAFVPASILFLVSIATPLHIFVARYRLVAVPGIALCWALLLSGFKPRGLQQFFCAAVVALTAYQSYRSPSALRHGYTWKYALEATEKNASIDNAPVLICSDMVESDYQPLPSGDRAADSLLYPSLSYYKITVPVVPLPRALNHTAMIVASSFLQDAGSRRQRFLAVGFIPSYELLGWITKQAAPTHTASVIGVFDGVMVVQFTPVRTSID